MAGQQVALGPLVGHSLPFLILSPRLSKMKILINIYSLLLLPPLLHATAHLSSFKDATHIGPLFLGATALVQVPLFLDNCNNSPSLPGTLSAACWLLKEGQQTAALPSKTKSGIVFWFPLDSLLSPPPIWF